MLENNDSEQLQSLESEGLYNKHELRILSSCLRFPSTLSYLSMCLFTSQNVRSKLK